MKPSSGTSICRRTACSSWLRAASVVLLLAAVAHADGKFFSRGVEVVETPDQRAILVFREGVETLVVESAFKGEGDEFAWVVPCPAPPEVAKADPGMFRTLAVVTPPEVRREVRHAWVVAVFLLVMFAVVAWLAGRTRRSRLWLVVALIMLGALFLFVAMLSPKGATLGAERSTVKVHGRARVGAYDVATVSAEAAGDLRAWLDRNGFQVAPESADAIAAYVADGWTFAVARLAEAGGNERHVAHPLAFTFPAERAVYPLRLTGAGNRDCRLDLHVFSDRRAEGGALPAIQAHRVKRAGGKWARWSRREPGDAITLGHAGLLELIGDASAYTLMRGILSPADQKRDLYLAWREFEPLVRHPMTWKAATVEAVNTAAWLSLLFFLVVGLLAAIFTHTRLARQSGRKWSEIFREHIGFEQRTLRFVWALALGGGIVAGLTVFLSTEKVDAVAMVVGHGGALRHDHYRAAQEIAKASDVAAARAGAAEFWKDQVNDFDGRPVMEERSPGNYVIESRDGRPVYVYHDATGRAFQGEP